MTAFRESGDDEPRTAPPARPDDVLRPAEPAVEVMPDWQAELSRVLSRVAASVTRQVAVENAPPAQLSAPAAASLALPSEATPSRATEAAAAPLATEPRAAPEPIAAPAARLAETLVTLLPPSQPPVGTATETPIAPPVFPPPAPPTQAPDAAAPPPPAPEQVHGVWPIATKPVEPPAPTPAPAVALERAPPPPKPPAAPAPETPTAAPAQPRNSDRWWHLARRAARVLAFLLLAWLAAVVGLIVLYRFVDPPASMLMIQQRLSGTETRQTFVPIERISPNLVRAVVLSEDGQFCRHNGIDLAAMRDAIERAKDGTPRGASTISMQLTKNLFLWPSKSYLRKAIELPLTLLVEAVWSKRRILEVYLNIVEWGPGVFGAEAAARHHFRKPADRLTEREAALLAVALPNPIERDAGDPGPGTLRLASNIQMRVKRAERVTGCLDLPGPRL